MLAMSDMERDTVERMTNEQAITELIAATKLITQALEEMRSYMSIIDLRVTALEAKQRKDEVEE